MVAAGLAVFFAVAFLFPAVFDDLAVLDVDLEEAAHSVVSAFGGDAGVPAVRKVGKFILEPVDEVALVFEVVDAGVSAYWVSWEFEAAWRICRCRCFQVVVGFVVFEFLEFVLSAGSEVVVLSESLYCFL